MGLIDIKVASVWTMGDGYYLILSWRIYTCIMGGGGGGESVYVVLDDVPGTPCLVQQNCSSSYRLRHDHKPLKVPSNPYYMIAPNPKTEMFSRIVLQLS